MCVRSESKSTVFPLASSGHNFLIRTGGDVRKERRIYDGSIDCDRDISTIGTTETAMEFWMLPNYCPKTTSAIKIILAMIYHILRRESCANEIVLFIGTRWMPIS